MPLTLYNTLGRELQEFKPLQPGKVGFYGCGPTVYNFPHIGNMRAYVFDDTLVRTLRYSGYQVTHVMNVTDVGHLSDDADAGEDKMVKSAAERGKTVWEIAEYYTAAFLSDADALNVVRPDVICRATAHIEDMIALIKRIEANGFTYSAGGNLYFDISKLPDYGKLARLNLEELKAGARIEVDANKRHPADFALWFTKSKFENQAMVWESPWGRGYPGWHIECSAMSMKYLGEQFDIHAGGIDHIPIHHSNEIAQSEAATGKKWVNYWLHNEFLVMSGGKMSKSKGGFITLRDLTKAGYDPMDYRFFLISGHYRSQLMFSYEALDSAKASRKVLAERLQALRLKAGSPAAPAGEKAKSYLNAFRAQMENDLNTPRALAELWGLLKDPDIPAAEALGAAFDMDRILGLRLEESSRTAAAPEVSDEERARIQALVDERVQAKKAKDYAGADAVRARLKAMGVVLEDGPAGTIWRKA
jgi:cysteinyl-tRNA synthetase